MPAEHARVKELFLAVLEMPAAERAAYLDTACADDTALRQQLEIMLQSQENSGELLPRPPAELLADSGATDADATAALALQPQGSPTSSEGGPTDGDEPLSFLEPSDKPGHLGRLGHYEIWQVIGKGGFGIVLKGFDERLHRVVAIKVLSPAYAANGSARKRFIREAQTAAAIKNEHVVGIYDVEKDAQPPYLAMEMIDGISLQDKLDKHGPLSVKEILRIGVQMAEGLAAAHKQGLVHRDIKPANILLENGVERVKITDFGLARAVDDASVTQSGVVAGTPMYMSPEQAEGLPVDHRSDLFSLGTVLYAMCTGHPPFRASGTHAVLKRVIDASPRPIREINNDVPDWLCDIIAKLHAKKPEDRFQSAKEVAELLGQRLSDVQAGRAPLVPSPKAVPPPEPIRTRRHWIAALALAGMGILFTYAAVMLFRAEQISPPGVQWIVAIVGLGMLLSGVYLAIQSVPNLGRTRATRQEIQDIELFVALLGFVVGFSLTIFSWYGLALLIPSLLAFIYFISPYEEEDSVATTGSAAPMSSWRKRRWALALPVLAGSFVVLFVIGFFWFRTGKSILFLAADDPAVRVSITGPDDTVTDVHTDGFVAVPAGVYNVMIECGGRQLVSVGASNADSGRTYRNGETGDRFKVVLRGDERVTLFVKTSPALAKEVGSEPGWVQLFNGKDLAGWKTLLAPEVWRVKDGILVGGGAKGYLVTEREFENFHFRVEAKFVGRMDSGQWFRFKPGANNQAYEAQIGGDTGTLLRIDAGGPLLLFRNKDNSVPADTWFTQEVVADGNRLKVILNDETVVNVVDDKYHRGHLALQSFNKEGTVYFSKIEIKELPPLPAAPPSAPNSVERLDRKKDLKAIGMAYTLCLEYRKKPPASAGDLKALLSADPKAWSALNDGSVVFFYNVGVLQMLEGASRTVLAYETRTPEIGGYVLMGDGSVRLVTADTFKKMRLAGPRPESGWVSLMHDQTVAGWGEIIDPQRDCTFANSTDGVTITVPGGHHNLNPAAPFTNLGAPRILQKTKGDFGVQVKVMPFDRPKAKTTTNGENSYVGAGLLFWKDSNNFVRFLRAANGESGRLIVSVEAFKGGKAQAWHDVDVPDEPTFLRAERRDGRYRFSHSRDAVKWTDCPIEWDHFLASELDVGVTATNSTIVTHVARFFSFDVKDVSK